MDGQNDSTIALSSPSLTERNDYMCPATWPIVWFFVSMANFSFYRGLISILEYLSHLLESVEDIESHLENSQLLSNCECKDDSLVKRRVANVKNVVSVGA